MSCVNPLNQHIYDALINKARIEKANLSRSAIYLKAADRVSKSEIDMNQYVKIMPAVQTYDLDKVYDRNNKIRTK